MHGALYIVIVQFVARGITRRYARTREREIREIFVDATTVAVFVVAWCGKETICRVLVVGAKNAKLVVCKVIEAVTFCDLLLSTST